MSENEKELEYKDCIIKQTTAGKKVIFDSDSKNDKIKFTKSIRWEVLRYYHVSFLAQDILIVLWSMSLGGRIPCFLKNAELAFMTGRGESKISNALKELIDQGIIYSDLKRLHTPTGYRNFRKITVNREYLTQLPLEAYEKIHSQLESIQSKGDSTSEELPEEVISEFEDSASFSVTTNTGEKFEF